MTGHSTPTLSVISPIWNESSRIESLLDYLELNSSPELIKEWIVVDGQSTDQSAEVVRQYAKTHAKVQLLLSKKGRAIQMNTGAKISKGTILYFLHADSTPPKHFDQAIVKAYHRGSRSGCFRMKFDNDHWWLQLAGWLTQLNWKACRGGDQSLFVDKYWFDHLGGYDERFRFCEDTDFIYKLYSSVGFEVIQQWITTSARRYQVNGIWKLQYHFWKIHLKKFLGATPLEIETYYLKHIQ